MLGTDADALLLVKIESSVKDSSTVEVKWHRAKEKTAEDRDIKLNGSIQISKKKKKMIRPPCRGIKAL